MGLKNQTNTQEEKGRIRTTIWIGDERHEKRSRGNEPRFSFSFTSKTTLVANQIQYSPKLA